MVYIPPTPFLYTYIWVSYIWISYIFGFHTFGFLPEHIVHLLVFLICGLYPSATLLIYLYLDFFYLDFIYLDFLYWIFPEHIVHLFVFLIFGLYPSATPHHPLCLVMTRIRAAIAQNPPRQFITHYVRARIFKV